MSTHDNGRIRALVLEDSPSDFALLETAVVQDPRSRLKPFLARSLGGALEMLEDAEFDLIILDLHVPDSAGVETFHAVRRRNRDLPIVVMTGLEDEAVGLELLQAGAQDYVVKGDLGGRAMVRCLVHAVERHRQHRELEAARLKAVDASEAKSRFLAAMSHEIRTPMNAILGMADVLLESGLRDDQADQVHVLGRAGEGLLELINGLLDFSKIEAGVLPLDNVDFPLWELLENSVELLAFSAHKKRLTLALDIDPKLPARVRGDPARLRQILINLLGNAVKFTNRGEVILRANAKPGSNANERRLLISVEDSGSGIARDKLESIFESFAQADPSIARCYGGSGLGLALSRKLAELMEGTLHAESDLGVGSRFLLEIPATLAQPAAFHNELRSCLEGRRALVVEPSTTERRILSQQLEEWGLNVWAVGGGTEALSMMRARPFDAVFLACRMAERGGMSLLQGESDLREIASQVVLLMPADRRPGDIDLCRALGVGGWIEKPIKPSSLYRCVGNIFGKIVNTESRLPPSPDLGSLRLLLVDDSLDNRSLIQAYLRGFPHIEVVSTSDGREAIHQFCSDRFDVVLMDIQMPVMDGYEATAAIRGIEKEQGWPRTPILALTAFAFDSERRRILEAGCDDVMVKPIRKRELVERLAQLRPSGRMDPIRVAADPDIEDLIPQYLASRRAELPELRNALERGDFETLRRIGHNLKGTGAGYGFDAISYAGRELEDAARGSDAARAGEQLDRIADFLDRIEVVSGESKYDLEREKGTE